MKDAKNLRCPQGWIPFACQGWLRNCSLRASENEHHFTPQISKIRNSKQVGNKEKTYFDYRLQIFTSYLRCTPLAIWCSSTTQFQSTIPGWMRSMICRERGISPEYEEVSSHLQNEKSVSETIIEVVHVRVKPKWVDPVAVRLTKALLFISKQNVGEISCTNISATRNLDGV